MMMFHSYVNVYQRVYGGFLSHGGTPSFNPAIRFGFSMIFHEINHPKLAWGTTMTMETTIHIIKYETFVDGHSYYPHTKPPYICLYISIYLYI